MDSSSTEPFFCALCLDCVLFAMDGGNLPKYEAASSLGAFAQESNRDSFPIYIAAEIIWNQVKPIRQGCLRLDQFLPCDRAD
jgi:hypothetical protein